MHTSMAASSASADSHHAARTSSDNTTVALMSDNIGIQNQDVKGEKWTKSGGGYGNRLRIRHAVSGSILCFPGPATAKNGWSLPDRTFNVGDLVGSNVLKVKDGVALTDEQLMVSAVLTAEGEMAPTSFSLKEVSQSGWVAVMTGKEVLPFKGMRCDEKDCAVVDDVETPRTPSPKVSPRTIVLTRRVI